MNKFVLKSPYTLQGDQPQAVEALVKGIRNRKQHQVLLGVTGSGKTFTMANVIVREQKPTLIISPNKTLAGQLFNEFKELFPENAVEFFVSYYDYYQPEAYVPSSDTYIEKDASINERIDRMRHSATTSLLTRKDVIVIASVSCIYGIGSPKTYLELAMRISKGQRISRDDLLRNLISIQYTRNDLDFVRGSFRVRGNNVEIYPASSDERIIRITFNDDQIEKIILKDFLLADVLQELEETLVFPASHYVSKKEDIERVIKQVKSDLAEQVHLFKNQNKLLEAERLEQRTRYDMEMLKETGYCNGIENYSRYLDGRNPGEPPSVLIDFMGNDFLLFIDESHITVPQIGGMHAGDLSRKKTLVEFGFRLPAAIDNRPLNFKEFESKLNYAIYVSATPGDYELQKAADYCVEQIIRPTGLLDPELEVRPTRNQVEDLFEEIRKITSRGERVLITTLTKKMAEKLTDYYSEKGVKAKYLHSDIETIERLKIISELRNGLFDVLIGINLLREGLDIPEVSLVGILEADQEGFLRSKRSLIQTFGRAARNINGKVILYADKITLAMKGAMEETERRRELQEKFNKENGITPKTIIKSRNNLILSIYDKDYLSVSKEFEEKKIFKSLPGVQKEISRLKKKMLMAAQKYHFEDAAKLRDQIKDLEKMMDNY